MAGGWIQFVFAFAAGEVKLRVVDRNRQEDFEEAAL